MAKIKRSRKKVNNVQYYQCSKSLKCLISTQTPPDLSECSPLVTRRSNETGQSWRRIMELGFGHYTLYRPTQSFLHKLCLNLSYSSQLNHSFLSKLYFNVPYSSFSSLLITNLSPNYISLSHILHILHY